jgi:hypothetical protein
VSSGCELEVRAYIDKDPRGTDINPQGTPFFFPPRLQEEVNDTLSRGGYDFPALPDEPPIRRVLDYGAGCGAFAVFAYKRLREPWIDCVESDSELATLCKTNLPPGGMVIPRPDDFSVYDAVRVSTPDVVQVLLRAKLDNVGIVFFDWRAEDDRSLCESACILAGLRLLVSKHFSVSRGRQIWVRSAST